MYTNNILYMHIYTLTLICVWTFRLMTLASTESMSVFKDISVYSGKWQNEIWTFYSAVFSGLYGINTVGFRIW